MRHFFLALALSLAACGPHPTAVNVHIDAQSLTITHLTLEVSLAQQPARTFDLSSPKLPGEARVLLPDVAQQVTVSAKAVDDQQRSWMATAKATAVPHADVDVDLKLGPAVVAGEDMAVGEDLPGGGPDMASAPGTPSLTLLAGALGGGSDSLDGKGAEARFSSPRGLAYYQGAVWVADNQDGTRLRRVAPDGTVTSLPIVDRNGGATGLYYATGMTSDGNGNVYVANWGGARVDKIELATGIMSTLVGNGPGSGDGKQGFADNPDGRQALVQNPMDIVWGGNDTLWLADTGNCAIRKITLTSPTTASVTTPVGGPTTTCCTRQWPYPPPVDGIGNGVPGKPAVACLPDPENVTVYNGLVYFTDGGALRVLDPAHDNTVSSITAAGDNGVFRGLVADGAGAFIVEDSFNVIRYIHPGTPPTDTVIVGMRDGGEPVDGKGTAARFTFLWNMTADDAGNLWLEDSTAIRKISMSDWNVTTVAGTPTFNYEVDGTRSRLDTPLGVACDGKSELVYFDDHWRSTIRQYDFMSQTVTTLVANNDSVSQPAGMTLDNKGRLWFVNQGSMTIAYMNVADHSVTVAAGKVGGGPPPDFNMPTDIVFDGDHTLYVADSDNHLLRTVDTETHAVGVLAGTGARGTNNSSFDKATFDNPAGLAYDGANHKLYISDRSASTIRVADLGAQTVAAVAGLAYYGAYVDGAPTVARFKEPSGLAVDGAAGKLYVADFGNHAVRVIDLVHPNVGTYVGDGRPITQPGTLPARIHGPWGLTPSAHGLVITDLLENALLAVY